MTQIKKTDLQIAQILVDAYKFSQQFQKKNYLQNQLKECFNQLATTGANIKVLFPSRYFANKKQDFDFLYTFEQIFIKQNFLQEFQKNILNPHNHDSLKQNDVFKFKKFTNHLTEFYNHKNYLLQLTLDHGFQPLISPKNPYQQLSYFNTKLKNSFIFGLPIQLCFYMRFPLVIRDIDSQYYYCYDISRLARYFRTSKKNIQQILLWALIIFMCLKNGNQDYIFIEVFKQKTFPHKKIQKKLIEDKSCELLNIFTFLKNFGSFVDLKKNFRVFSKIFKIPYFLILKVYQEIIQGVVFDERLQKLIDFNFESQKSKVFLNEILEKAIYASSFYNRYASDFSHLLQIKKNSITFQTHQFQPPGHLPINILTQSFHKINENTLKKMAVILFNKLPELIIFKQFFQIDYFRFNEDANFISNLQPLFQKKNQTYSIVGIQNSIFNKKIQKVEKEVLKKSLMDFYYSSDLFSQNVKQNQQNANFIQKMKQHGHFESSIQLLYLMKFDCFRVENFLVKEDFYDCSFYRRKQLEKIDEHQLFIYRSEMLGFDYQNLLNFEQLMNTKSLTKDIKFKVLNFFWNLERGKFTKNQFGLQENIRFTLLSLFFQHKHMHNKEQLWETLISPIFQNHQCISLLTLIYLLISKPGPSTQWTDLVVCRQAYLLNFIRNKFHSALKTNLEYFGLFTQNKYKENPQGFSFLPDFFSAPCSPKNACVFKELIVLLISLKALKKPQRNLSSALLKQINQLKESLEKDVPLAQFSIFISNFKSCLQQTRLSKNNKSFYRTLEEAEILLKKVLYEFKQFNQE